jgi:hypothetical protein
MTCDFVIIGEFSQLSGPELVWSFPRLAGDNSRVKSLINEMVNMFPQSEVDNMSEEIDFVHELFPCASSRHTNALVNNDLLNENC